MSFTINPATPIDGEAVLPLVDAKAHLRVLDDDEDALIEALRTAAIDWIERHCGVALGRRSFVLSHSDGGFWGAAPLRLPIGPVISVEGVGYLDSAGTVQALVAVTDWRLASNALVPVAGGIWPATLCGPGAITVSFTAGYADALAEAPALVAAVKMLLGHLYKFREAVISGVSISEVPFGVTALCAAYRGQVL